jgi:NAD(P)-dependent dehydrogenase (short-subunit alcohol dehydrogenase family)
MENLMAEAPLPNGTDTPRSALGVAGGVALVTGAGSGIGRATAIRFAQAGASVVIADIDLVGAEETAERVRAFDVPALTLQVDVSQDDAISEMIDTTIAEYGRIDFAHNNAGIVGKQLRLIDYAIEDIDRLLIVNLRSVIQCMRAELPHMLSAGRGVIVNTASEAALKGGAADAIYTATKHGVAGITKSAALEVARKGLRVNAVCPGVIASGITEQLARDNPKQYRKSEQLMPVRRFGQPEEIADAVVWLCSNEARLINGHLLAIDGGWSAT